MNTQDKLRDLIRQARVETSVRTDERLLRGALDLLCEQGNEQTAQKGRWLMYRRISQLGIAAVVLFAVILGIGNLGQGSVTFAGVLEYLQQRCYAFDLTVSDSETDDAPGSVEVRIQQPGRMRFECEVGRCPISAIVDVASGDSLILYHAYKTANWVPTKEEFREVGESGLFLLSARPVEDLWNLRDGSEERLGKRTIEGRKARGFRVRQSDEQFSHTMTIWADIDTGRPLEVKIVSIPHEDSARKLIWLLTHFDMDRPVDEQCFGMEVPEGYTLKGRVKLRDLNFEPGETEHARRLREALTSWDQGNHNQAIDRLFTVDWDQPLVPLDDAPYAPHRLQL